MSQRGDADARQGTPVEKVTAFVLGQRNGVDELLLLYHPHAGIQLPAGTVEPGESAMAAALREAQEETGLSGLVWGGLAGEEREALPPDVGVVSMTTPVYTRHDLTSLAMGTLRRGFTVEIKRAVDDFLQVRYAESDHYPDPQFVSFELMGWVPAATISGVRVRYFGWLVAPDNTPPSWTTYNDFHHFTLRWHPLDALPEVVAPQAPWLQFLPKK